PASLSFHVPVSCSSSPAPPALHPRPLHDALPIFVNITPRAHVRKPPLIDRPAALHRGQRYAVHLVALYSIRMADRVEVHGVPLRSEEHTSELQSRFELVCRLLLEKKHNNTTTSNL